LLSTFEFINFAILVVFNVLTSSYLINPPLDKLPDFTKDLNDYKNRKPISDNIINKLTLHNINNKIYN